MKCKCGMELKKITKKHLESQYHLEHIVSKDIINEIDYDKDKKDAMNELAKYGFDLEKIQPEIKNKILSDKSISQYQTDKYLFKSNLNENKFDAKGNYIISKNSRPKFKRVPKRLLIIFYDRDSKNCYTISDYNTNPVVVVDDRVFFLAKVFYINEGIPAYALILNTPMSIDLQFFQINDEILLKEQVLDPSVAKNYIESIAVKYMYAPKEKDVKYNWYNFIIDILLVITSVAITIPSCFVVFGGI